LAKLGAATWGNTQEEALKHIHEVVEIIVQELVEDRQGDQPMLSPAR
jgi:predicted RNase H-like HicB family nuclease